LLPHGGSFSWSQKRKGKKKRRARKEAGFHQMDAARQRETNNINEGLSPRLGNGHGAETRLGSEQCGSVEKRIRIRGGAPDLGGKKKEKRLLKVGGEEGSQSGVEGTPRRGESWNGGTAEDKGSNIQTQGAHR